MAVAITGFPHKGLARFFATGVMQGIQSKHADRLRLILGRLNVSVSARDMNLPGLGLHELHRQKDGHTVSERERQIGESHSAVRRNGRNREFTPPNPAVPRPPIPTDSRVPQGWPCP